MGMMKVCRLGVGQSWSVRSQNTPGAYTTRFSYVSPVTNRRPSRSRGATGRAAAARPRQARRPGRPLAPGT